MSVLIAVTADTCAYTSTHIANISDISLSALYT